MMDAEQKAKESFKQMETELIDKLDILEFESWSLKNLKLGRICALFLYKTESLLHQTGWFKSVSAEVV